MRLTLKDAVFANRIFADESIYPHISDDFCKPEHRYIGGTIVLQNPLIYLLSPNEYTIFMLIPWNSACYDVHTLVLPEGRGRMAVEAGRAAARWMFENTDCEKLVGRVPADNRRMIAYSYKVGFRKEGVCTKSWKKNGLLIDQVMFGLEKEQLCQPSL